MAHTEVSTLTFLLQAGYFSSILTLSSPSHSVGLGIVILVLQVGRLRLRSLKPRHEPRPEACCPVDRRWPWGTVLHPGHAHLYRLEGRRRAGQRSATSAQVCGSRGTHHHWNMGIFAWGHLRPSAGQRQARQDRRQSQSPLKARQHLAWSIPAPFDRRLGPFHAQPTSTSTSRSFLGQNGFEFIAHLGPI